MSTEDLAGFTLKPVLVCMGLMNDQMSAEDSVSSDTAGTGAHSKDLSLGCSNRPWEATKTPEQ